MHLKLANVENYYLFDFKLFSLHANLELLNNAG